MRARQVLLPLDPDETTGMHWADLPETTQREIAGHYGRLLVKAAQARRSESTRDAKRGDDDERLS